MEEKISFTNSKGDKLVGVLAKPSDSIDIPITIICHGFATNKNRPKYTELAKKLYENDIASLRFDLFGHGESEGDFADITITEGIDDVLQAIEYAKSLGYAKISLVGSSFGGITSFFVATKTNDLFALALISPVSDFPEVERMRRSEADIVQWQKDGFIIHKNSKDQEFRLNYSFWEDIQKYLVYDIADQIKIPTLIVHGDADDLVPIEQSRKTAKLIPNCQLIEIKGATHRYEDQNHFAQMINAVSKFIIEKKD